MLFNKCSTKIYTTISIRLIKLCESKEGEKIKGRERGQKKERNELVNEEKTKENEKK